MAWRRNLIGYKTGSIYPHLITNLDHCVREQRSDLIGPRWSQTFIGWALFGPKIWLGPKFQT